MGSRRDEGPGDGEVRAYSGRPADWDSSEDITGLGQEVAARFLAAGLELNSALSMMGECPAADRCARALAELDEAIGQVRHLALAAHKRAGDLKSPPEGRPCTGPWSGKSGGERTGRDSLG